MDGSDARNRVGGSDAVSGTGGSDGVARLGDSGSGTWVDGSDRETGMGGSEDVTTMGESGGGTTADDSDGRIRMGRMGRSDGGTVVPVVFCQPSEPIRGRVNIVGFLSTNTCGAEHQHLWCWWSI